MRRKKRVCGGTHGCRPTKYNVGQGPCALPKVRCKPGSGRRGNRRSAASGRCSKAISRKCPDWRPRQWPGIGWHDGGQPPPPTPILSIILHISCALCVDSLWITFNPKIFSLFCGNPPFPLWTKNPGISRSRRTFPQKFSLRLLLLKTT